MNFSGLYEFLRFDDWIDGILIEFHMYHFHYPVQVLGKMDFHRSGTFKVFDPRIYFTEAITSASAQSSSAICANRRGASKSGPRIGRPLPPLQSLGRSRCTRKPKAMGYDLSFSAQTGVSKLHASTWQQSNTHAHTHRNHGAEGNENTEVPAA